MFSAFFLAILISVATGLGFDIKDTVTIEIKSSPLPTVAALFTTATPSPSFTPEASPAHAGPTSSPTVSKDCDFEYHKTTTNGEPIDFEYNCTDETNGGGSASTSVNVEANSNGGNVKNSVDVSVSTN